MSEPDVTKPPINSKAQQHMTGLVDQILHDLDFDNELELMTYLNEQPNPLLRFVELLHLKKWCFYHSVDEEVVTVQNWVSTRLSLPSDHEKVLVMTTESEIKIGYIHQPFEDREWSFDNDREPYGFSKVTHWQKLPVIHEYK